MILEILNLVVSFAKAAVTAPDVKPEYYDIDLETAGQNRDFVDRLIATLPTDTDGMKYPESEAKKKLKRVMDLYYQVIDFQKYLSEKAAAVNKERMEQLSALSKLDDELAYAAAIYQFWQSLSDEYIQDLQDRINKLDQERVSLYGQLHHLNYEMGVLQKRIETLDKDLEKEAIKLTEIAESRIDAVTNVVNDSIKNHLEVFDELSTNLKSIIQQKTDELHQAEHALAQYDKENPQGVDRESFVGVVNARKDELNRATEALKRVKQQSDKLTKESNELSTELKNSKEIFRAAKGYKDKLDAVDKYEQNNCKQEHLFHNLNIAKPTFRNDIMNLLHGLPAERTESIESTFNKLKDFSQPMEVAESTNKERLAATKAIIQDKVKQRNNLEESLVDKMQQAKTIKETIDNHQKKYVALEKEIKSINPDYIDITKISKFHPKEKEQSNNQSNLRAPKT